MSGVFFSLDRLPEAFRAVAELNPAWYVIDGMRHGLTGTAVAAPWTGCVVLLAVNAALWLLCWGLFASGYKTKA
jgi:ABC-2 type transport system permease protein